MASPEIASLIDALEQQPHRFFLRDGYLQQWNSSERVAVHFGGPLVIVVEPDGARRPLSHHEAEMLAAAFRKWQQEFWIPVRVNTAFADQLRPPGLWRRLWHWLASCLPERDGESALATYASAFAGDQPEDPGADDPPPGRRATGPRRPLMPGGKAEPQHLLQLVD